MKLNWVGGEGVKNKCPLSVGGGSGCLNIFWNRTISAYFSQLAFSFQGRQQIAY